MLKSQPDTDLRMFVMASSQWIWISSPIKATRFKKESYFHVGGVGGDVPGGFLSTVGNACLISHA